MPTPVNTGNVIVVTLMKVRSDITDTSDPLYREAMDINNHPCRISGLPQATKSNTVGDPDYIAPYIDTDRCPV